MTKPIFLSSANVLKITTCAILVLSGCSSSHCDEVSGSTPTISRFAFLDKQVFVYRSSELFELDQPVLLDTAELKLKPVIAFAKKNPDMLIAISSYSADASNSSLSTEYRDFSAEALAARLWSSGVQNPMRYQGYPGGKHSVSSNRVAAIGADNRRIEIEFYDQKYVKA